jgi:aerobic-type carbon monoxide dehydrogenase small subunit (CoxS/CutS family)
MDPMRPAPPGAMETEGDRSVQVSFRLNGAPCTVRVPPETTLLRCLREYLLLTGTKCGCEIGQCGACTVIIDGTAAASCLVLTPQLEGAELLTIEGLAREVTPEGDGLHPLQRAFLDCDAVACGFCTPGMLLSAKALLDEHPHPTREQIRRAISGNLCRCTGYLPIMDAIEHAARRMTDDN